MKNQGIGCLHQKAMAFYDHALTLEKENNASPKECFDLAIKFEERAVAKILKYDINEGEPTI